MPPSRQASPKGDHSGLELDQDLAYQRRAWRAQRIAWLIMLLIVLAALIGLFGHGPLSRTTVGPNGGLQLEYERFARLLTPTTLRFRTSSGAIQGDELRLWISNDYLQGIQIEHVSPMPQTVEAGPDGLVFVFRLTEPGRPMTATFQARPERIGRISGHAALTDRQPIRFNQFVYP